MAKPEWYERAIAATRIDAEVIVDDCKIHYATWGEIGKPGIVLIHGSNAHLEWWRFVAPFLADHFRIAAIDLSGNGDSGWRNNYTAEMFAKEVMAVAQHAELGDSPFIVGHSFGGYIALETGYIYGDQLGGVLFCDYVVPSPELFVQWGLSAAENGPARPTKVYKNLDDALGRFRLLPEQPCQHPYVIEYIAKQSLRKVDDGWTWKFDPSMYDCLEISSEQPEKLRDMTCPSAFVLGEYSEDYNSGSVAFTQQITEGKAPIYQIPGTYHHYMFDEPIAVYSAINGILLTWSSSSSLA